MAWVTGLQGTEVREVVALALHVPICFALHSTLVHTVTADREDGGRGVVGRRGWLSSSAWWRLVDAALYSLCIVLPLTLSLTLAADSLLRLALLEAAALLVAGGLAWARDGGDALQRPPSASTVASPLSACASPSPTQFLSLYRVSLLLTTAVAILAVDFAIFPRRLAKTEEFGVSPVNAAQPPRTCTAAPPPPLPTLHADTRLVRASCAQRRWTAGWAASSSRPR